MSSPPPASTTPAGPLPASTAAATTTAAAITPPSAPPPTPVVYTPERMSGANNDLVTAVHGIRLYPIAAAAPATCPALAAVAAAPHHRAGLHRHERHPYSASPLPPLPSPLPDWITESSSPPPVYSTAGDPPMPTLPDATTVGFAGPYAGRAAPYGHGGAAPTPPRFTKLDFATFDGSEDPLNWLNQ
nr:extensin-like [Lolium perenne]